MYSTSRLIGLYFLTRHRHYSGIYHSSEFVCIGRELIVLSHYCGPSGILEVMASPSPFIPPRPLSRSAPPVNPNVVPPLAQGQPPPGGAPSRGRQPGGFSGHPGTFTGGSPYHILPNNIPWVIPDNPIAPAGNAGFSSDWTGFPADLLSSSAGPPPPAPAAAQAPPAGAPPAGFGPVGPTPQAANWSVPLPAGYGSAPSTGYVPYQSLPVFGMPSFPGMMGIAGLPGMPGMQGVPMVPQSTPGNRTQAFPNTPGPGMPPQMGWFPPGAGMFTTPHPPHPMQMPAYGFTPYPVPNANLPPGFGASGFGPPPPGVPPAPSRRSSRHGRARSTERMDIFDKWLPGPSCESPRSLLRPIPRDLSFSECLSFDRLR